MLSGKRSHRKRGHEAEESSTSVLAMKARKVAKTIHVLTKNEVDIDEFYNVVIKISDFDNDILNNVFDYLVQNDSHKHQRYSRAYIDFKNPEDVLEFAGFFHGHVFVNEKGSQFKAIVEYAPYQRVPKRCTKKDDREGTIYRDPDYLEFLKLIAKPAQNLHSSEIQLERKEAEESEAAKKAPISTPLMEFVRQKRANRGGSKGSAVVKDRKRAGSASLTNSSSNNTKRGSAKKKGKNKNANRKDKSVIIVARRNEDQPTTSSGKESKVESISGVQGSPSKISLGAESGKKKKLLLKGKTREISLESEGMLQQLGLTTNVRSSVFTAAKQYQRPEASERPNKSILPSTTAWPPKKFQNLEVENDKLPIQPKTTEMGLNGHVPYSEPPASISDNGVKRSSDDKLVKKDRHGLTSHIEKREKPIRNKDRPDCRIWTPRPGKHGNVEQLASSVLQSEVHSDFVRATRGEIKDGTQYKDLNGESTGPTSGSNNSSAENGSSRNFSRHMVAHERKHDGSPSATGRKFSRKGPAGYNAHEELNYVFGFCFAETSMGSEVIRVEESRQMADVDSTITNALMYKVPNTCACSATATQGSGLIWVKCLFSSAANGMNLALDARKNAAGLLSDVFAGFYWRT
ncbi:unnamed protein product [Dovyalis caffra]|uniref:UPF3 domain-containing protein n=1 Tax=Dovyalis caffra TaxID=77055 RepID=A0AAV1S5Q8_9ROSI|nr:unnamed protein product [Dovyalis caffra]